MRTKRLQKRRHDETPQAQAELDLHGFTSYEAEMAVEELLEESMERKLTHLRIIVGKGTCSPNNEAVLPYVVKSVLNKYPYTYTHARKEDGGEGALEVTLT